jgi:acetyl-CoA carboxylase biotin carboxyl carrier protein
VTENVSKRAGRGAAEDAASQGDAGPAIDPANVQMVLKETKDLIKLLEGTTMKRVKVRAAGLDIELERQDAGTVVTYASAPPPASASGPAAAGAPAPAAKPGRMPVVAPLVGVFYRASSPGAKPFADVGDTVERGQVVGIVEAMKMMNEVSAGQRGRVAEILVDNEEYVEFGQALMYLEPLDGQ